MLGPDNNLYGTTSRGGVGFPSAGYGTIFRVTIDGGITTLLSFNGGSDGAYPASGLAQAGSLVFYGTTSEGGTKDARAGGDGTIFRFVCPGGPLSLANVGPQSLQVGQTLIFTNFVFGGTGPITLSLDASDPAGTSLDTNNVFSWTPECTQGSTTNAITIWATDSSVPPVSNSMTFSVVVGPCVLVTVGSSPVQIGHSTCVALDVLSTGEITNLSFGLRTLAGRFTNWTVSAASGAIATATVRDTDPSMPQFSLTTKPGQSLIGNSVAANICVSVLDTGDSTFATVQFTNIVALSPVTGAPVPAFGQGGELIIIADTNRRPAERWASAFPATEQARPSRSTEIRGPIILCSMPRASTRPFFGRRLPTTPCPACPRISRKSPHPTRPSISAPSTSTRHSQPAKGDAVGEERGSVSRSIPAGSKAACVVTATQQCSALLRLTEPRSETCRTLGRTG